MAIKIKNSVVIDDNKNILANTYNGYIPADKSLTITAGSGLTGSGSLSANVVISVLSGSGLVANTSGLHVDSTVLRTTGNQSISGIKTFSSNVDMSSKNIVNLASPINDADAVNKLYVDSTSSSFYKINSVAGSYETDFNNIVENKAFSFNSSTLNGPGSFFGQGISFVNGPISNSTNSMTLIVAKAGGDNLWFRRKNANTYYNWNEFVHSGNIETYIANSQITYTNGTGLNLSGTTFSFNTSWGDARYTVATRTITAGNGLTGGGDLSSNVTLAVGSGDGISVSTTQVSVDSTVVRTSGVQTINGNKIFSSFSGTFSANVNSNGNTITGLPDPIGAGQPVTLGYFANYSIGHSGYSWVNMTSSRDSGVSYHNTTGGPIQVYIKSGYGDNLYLSANGTTWMDFGDVDTDTDDQDNVVSFIVPDDWYYKYTYNTLIKWMELRT